MIEETILNVNPAKDNAKKEQTVQNVQEAAKNLKKKGRSWATVTLGGVSGILLGAGSAAGAHAYTSGQNATTESGEPQTTDEANQTTDAPQATTVNDNQSFAEAFEAARAEVGPDGVFVWHNGTYTAHTKDEWNAMTAQQQESAVENAGVATPGSEVVQLPTDGNPEPFINVEPGVNIVDPEPEPEQLAGGGDSQGTDGTDGSNGGDDVAIVGISEADGHIAAQVDLDGDGESDITIVDVDDNGEVSDPDVIIDNEGNSATYAEFINGAEGGEDAGEGGDTYYAGIEENGGEIEEEIDTTTGNIDDLASEGDGSDVAYLNNPDVAEDMPDYMNDVIV